MIPGDLISRVRLLLGPHDGKDNSTYWRGRAASLGSAAVLWSNTHYNELVREQEYAILKPSLELTPMNAEVLDIGCGIGTVTKWMLAVRPDLHIHCVDFPEMIARAKKELGNDERITFLACSADEFRKDGAFDLVISSACYSMIRNKEKCIRALDLGTDAVKTGGRFVLIDPFHSWNYLARVKMSAKEVMELVQSKRFSLLEFDGILFWPFREALANSNLSASMVRRCFSLGEKLMNALGSRLWSDYKVMVFEKK